MINIETRGQKQVMVDSEWKKNLPHITHKEQGQNYYI